MSEGPALSARELASLFERTVDRLSALREDWLEGDDKMANLVSVIGSETGGFEKIVRDEYRAPVSRGIRALRQDYVEVILPHLPLPLAERLLRVLQATDPSGFGTDTYGESRERWRMTWPVTGLQEEYQVLTSLLMAEAQATRQRASQAPDAMPSGPGASGSCEELRLAPRFLKAGGQWKQVRAKLGLSLEHSPIDARDYAALVEMLDELGLTKADLRPEATWVRYARAYREALFGKRNSAVGGRTGRSLMRPDGRRSEPDP